MNYLQGLVCATESEFCCLVCSNLHNSWHVAPYDRSEDTNLTKISEAREGSK